MLICNQRRLNFEFWRSSFTRMRGVGVASKIKRLSSSLPAVHLQHEGGLELPRQREAADACYKDV